MPHNVIITLIVTTYHIYLVAIPYVYTGYQCLFSYMYIYIYRRCTVLYNYIICEPMRTTNQRCSPATEPPNFLQQRPRRLVLGQRSCFFFEFIVIKKTDCICLCSNAMFVCCSHDRWGFSIHPFFDRTGLPSSSGRFKKVINRVNAAAGAAMR